MLDLDHTMISIFTPITQIIDLIAMLFILLGLVKALYKYFTLRIKNKAVSGHDIKVIRAGLGTYLLLGLEIMICADIIKTVLHQTKDELIFLGGIVAIRTVLSYFLNREIGEIENEL